MPGHSPQEAVKNYIDPLQRAVSCLKGGAKIVQTNKVRRVGDTGAWILNGATGMVLPRFGVFHAQQLFELVECDPKRFDLSAGKYRVSTRMYAYNLVADEGWKMQWHWHPDGNSPEHRPHIHPTVNPKAHMPSGRHTLEDIVEGCIQLGAQPGCDDWAKRLLETSGPHKLYRTWVNDPNENAPASSSTAE